MFKVKSDLPPLNQPRITVQLDARFIGGSSSEQDIMNTAEMQYVEDNKMTTCQKGQKKIEAEIQKKKDCQNEA